MVSVIFNGLTYSGWPGRRFAPMLKIVGLYHNNKRSQSRNKLVKNAAQSQNADSLHTADMPAHLAFNEHTSLRAVESLTRVRLIVAIHGQLLLCCDQSMREKAWRSRKRGA